MVDQFLQDLEQYKKAHIAEAKAIAEASQGAVYPFDLLARAVLNRSMSLTSGFITLMRLDNFVSAAPLIRLQLDNHLRFAAGWLVSDPHDFAVKILEGTQVRHLKTRDGKKMTDRFLVEEFAREHPWIESVYENTSGYVHLSDKHLYANVRDMDDVSKTITFTVSATDEHLPEEIKVEAIMAFAEITKLVLHRAYSWRYTKENPPVVNGTPLTTRLRSPLSVD